VAVGNAKHRSDRDSNVFRWSELSTTIRTANICAKLPTKLTAVWFTKRGTNKPAQFTTFLRTNQSAFRRVKQSANFGALGPADIRTLQWTFATTSWPTQYATIIPTKWCTIEPALWSTICAANIASIDAAVLATNPAYGWSYPGSNEIAHRWANLGSHSDPYSWSYFGSHSDSYSWSYFGSHSDPYRWSYFGSHGGAYCWTYSGSNRLPYRWTNLGSHGGAYRGSYAGSRYIGSTDRGADFIHCVSNRCANVPVGGTYASTYQCPHSGVLAQDDVQWHQQRTVASVNPSNHRFIFEPVALCVVFPLCFVNDDDDFAFLAEQCPVHSSGYIYRQSRVIDCCSSIGREIAVESE
jgi:hypothetical protein